MADNGKSGLINLYSCELEKKKEKVLFLSENIKYIAF